MRSLTRIALAAALALAVHRPAFAAEDDDKVDTTRWVAKPVMLVEPPEVREVPGSDAGDLLLRYYKDGYVFVTDDEDVVAIDDDDAIFKSARKMGARYAIKYRMIDSAQQAPRAAQSRFIATPEQLAPIVYSTSPTRYDSILKHVRYVTTRAGVLYFIPVERKGLGAMWLPASPEQAAQLHNDKAVVIVAIRAGSPAERAGLVAGDAVVKLNGREVDLRAEVEAPPGRITSITIIRASATRTIPVAVAADGSWSLPPPVARRR